MFFWIRYEGFNSVGIRCQLATALGRFFPPALYIAPRYKRDKWHKIACELPPELCPTCSRYYGLSE